MTVTNKKKIGAAAAMGLAAMSFPLSAHAALVINEVYGGGASTNTTTSYSSDFFELFNNGTAAINLTGYVLEYASAAGAFPTTATSGNVANLSGSIAPGGYYLVSGGANTTAGAALPTPDATSGIQAAATAGKLGLFDSFGGTLLDLVGYGTTASTFEGTGPAPSPSITTSISRTGGIDTNQNATDFLSTAPTPQNSGGGATPEPTTLGLAAAGALMLARRRR